MAIFGDGERIMVGKNTAKSSLNRYLFETIFFHESKSARLCNLRVSGRSHLINAGLI